MGMSLIYRRLSDEQRKGLERDPPFSGSLFPAGTPPPVPPEVVAQMKQKMRELGLLKRIFLWFMLRRMNDRNILSLDKSWHVVHFLLTGERTMNPSHSSDNPLHNVVIGGRPTPIDSTFGPVRVIEKADVKKIATALSDVNTDSLRLKYSLADLNAADLYGTPEPGGWDSRELEIVFACIPRLKAFFADAAASN